MKTNLLGYQNNGYTLIELVVFMIIVSIAAAGILLGLNVALTAYPDEVNARRAMEIANTRMEYVVGRSDIYALPDNCSDVSPPPICSVPADFTVDTTYTPLSATDFTVTVAVTGAGYATLVTVVALL